MEIKSIFIIFKGLSLKQIKQYFLEDESPNLNFGDQQLLKSTFKGALSGLRQFLEVESPFYLTLKARFVLKTFKFLS